jgi:MFS family permease
MRFTEMNEIYWFMILRSFALSLIGIFVPIFLYKANFGVSNIFLYYISLYFFEFIFEYIAARFMKLRGPKHSMILSLPFLIVHIWQLMTLSQFHWSPLALAVSLSIALAFFWEGYHYDFSRSKHTAKTTREVGKIFIAMTLIGAAAPLIGGLIATYFGTKPLLIIVIVLLILGSLVLLKTKDRNFRKGKFDISKVSLTNIDRHLVSYAGLGWETVSTGQIWPLFLFFIISSYSGIGLITSATLILSILVTYWVSRRSDSGKRAEYLRSGSVLNGVVCFLQVFVETVTQAFAVNVGRSLAQSAFKPPFDSEYYLHADEESRSEYIYIMESAVDLSRLIFHIIMYVLSLSFSLHVVLIVGLIMGALGSLLVSLMPAAKCEICGEIENKKIVTQRRMA